MAWKPKETHPRYTQQGGKTKKSIREEQTKIQRAKKTIEKYGSSSQHQLEVKSAKEILEKNIVETTAKPSTKTAAPLPKQTLKQAAGSEGGSIRIVSSTPITPYSSQLEQGLAAAKIAEQKGSIQASKKQYETLTKDYETKPTEKKYNTLKQMETSINKDIIKNRNLVQQFNVKSMASTRAWNAELTQKNAEKMIKEETRLQLAEGTPAATKNIAGSLKGTTLTDITQDYQKELSKAFKQAKSNPIEAGLTLLNPPSAAGGKIGEMAGAALMTETGYKPSKFYIMPTGDTAQQKVTVTPPTKSALLAFGEAEYRKTSVYTPRMQAADKLAFSKLVGQTTGAAASPVIYSKVGAGVMGVTSKFKSANIKQMVNIDSKMETIKIKVSSPFKGKGSASTGSLSKSGVEKQTISGITGRKLQTETNVFKMTGKTTGVNIDVKQGKDLLPISGGKTTTPRGNIYSLGVDTKTTQAGLYLAKPSTGSTQLGYYSGANIAKKGTQTISGIQYKGISKDFLLGIKGKTLARETIGIPTTMGGASGTLTQTFTTTTYITGGLSGGLSNTLTKTKLSTPSLPSMTRTASKTITEGTITTPLSEGLKTKSMGALAPMQTTKKHKPFKQSFDTQTKTTTTTKIGTTMQTTPPKIDYYLPSLTTSKSKQNTSTQAIEIPRIQNINLKPSSTRIVPATKIDLGQPEDQIIEPIDRIDTRTRTKTEFVYLPSMPITTTSVVILPPSQPPPPSPVLPPMALPSLDFGGGYTTRKTKKRKKGKQRKKYTPSLAAELTGSYTTRIPKKMFTGLEIRPLIK